MPSLDQSPGRPGFSIFRLLPRLNPRVAPKLRFPRLAEWWLFGFPRFLHLPAMPAVNFQVAPNLRSSGGACCVEVRVASNPAPFSAPGDQVLGRPSPLIFRRIRFTIPPGCPVSSFLRLRQRWSSGSPRCLASSGFAASRLRVSANPASTAGPMMSPASSNFASSGVSQLMNLRVNRYKHSLA